ncbi:hypothetical protein ACYCSE_15410 [Paenibacillus sp. SEL1]
MLKVLYSFVCDQVFARKIEDRNYDFSAIGILDKRTFDSLPVKLENEIIFVVGMTGEESDDGKDVYLNVRGKDIKFNLPLFNYSFNGYDEITVSSINFNEFPVNVEGTVYFEIYYNNKVISSYPVKFLRKEEG